MNEATQTGAESIEARIAAALDDNNETPMNPQEPSEAEEKQPIDEKAGEGSEEPEQPEDTESKEEESEGEETSEPEDAVEEYELDAGGLAEILGIEGEHVNVDDDGQITFRTKIDGEVSQAKLADLVKSYQLEGHLNKKSMSLAEERKAFEAEAQSQKQALMDRLEIADHMTQAAEKSLLQEYEAVKWDELKENDPGRYAAMQQDFGMRYQQIQQIKGGAAEIAQQAQQERLQQEQAQRNKLYQEQNELLLAANPSWNNPEIRQAETEKIVEYAKSVGFTDDEVVNVLDARVVRILLDAVKAKDTQSKVEVVKKKVKRVPKIMRPGSQANKQAQSQRNTEKKLTKLRKSGDDGALTDVLWDRISV